MTTRVRTSCESQARSRICCTQYFLWHLYGMYDLRHNGAVRKLNMSRSAHAQRDFIFHNALWQATKYVFLAFVVKNIFRNKWETSISMNVFVTLAFGSCYNLIFRKKTNEIARILMKLMKNCRKSLVFIIIFAFSFVIFRTAAFTKINFFSLVAK